MHTQRLPLRPAVSRFEALRLRLSSALAATGLALLIPSSAACASETNRAPASTQPASTAKLAQLEPLPGGTQFRERIDALSESGGYFDTDNLISNESSYLHPVRALNQLGVRGGAYVGVGPDQNFSYIAHIKPEIAFIVDVRRDNMLQHLLLKAIFEASGSRVEYLAMLYARPLPPDPDSWTDRPLQAQIAWIDDQSSTPELRAQALSQVADRVRSYGFDNSEDLETIERFHDQFIRHGLSLRFNSHGRPPRSTYPDHRRLLLETDLNGEQASFLASETLYEDVRTLQLTNRIIPVVGNLAGPEALGNVGRRMSELDLELSAIYTSNVEFYLWRQRSFQRFADSLASFPVNDRSVLIRSYFGRSWGMGPRALPGHGSVQLVQSVDDLVQTHQNDGFVGYHQLIERGRIDLTRPYDPNR